MSASELQFKVQAKKARAKLVKLLKTVGWLVEPTPANAFERGSPNLYCHHPKWRSRWVIVQPDGCSLSTRQRRRLPLWLRANVKIWVLRGESDYNLLFMPPNLPRLLKNSITIPDGNSLPDKPDRDTEQTQLSGQDP
jgi:hypothetical protein